MALGDERASSRGRPRRRWRCWVVGVSDARPTFLAHPPSIPSLRDVFITNVQEHYRVKREDAELLIEQASLKLAVVPPDGALISYKGLTDLKPVLP